MVAGHGEAEAGAVGKALDRGDHRLVSAHDQMQELALVAHELAAAFGRHRREARHVAAGREASFRAGQYRSEEHTSELQSLMRSSYAVFCLKKKKTKPPHLHN